MITKLKPETGIQQVLHLLLLESLLLMRKSGKNLSKMLDVAASKFVRLPTNLSTYCILHTAYYIHRPFVIHLN